MTDSTDTREPGRKVVRQMLGDEFLGRMEGYAASEHIFSDAAKFALDFVFTQVWARPGLDLRSRSLVTIGVLVASGKPDELRNHVRAGLNNGLTLKEIEEALIQTIPYAGFPAFAQAQLAVMAELREQGVDTGGTPEERGLLLKGKA